MGREEGLGIIVHSGSGATEGMCATPTYYPHRPQQELESISQVHVECGTVIFPLAFKQHFAPPVAFPLSLQRALSVSVCVFVSLPLV